MPGYYKKNYQKKNTRQVTTGSGKTLKGYWKNGVFIPYPNQ